MICSSCGAESRDGKRFCIRCGSVIASVCPSCGAPNELDAAFCGDCGARIDVNRQHVAAGGGASSAASSTERRQVSVLFADLVGFTPFAEDRDPEDVRATLSRYFDLAAEITARLGGTVEKFIGDAVMAVWGVPVRRELDAERAVRAALEIVEAVSSLGPGIRARAAVQTGEAAVTVGATNQGLVAGDIVNTASRLQSVAPPGWVLVGEATRRAASACVAFDEMIPQRLKGKDTPVPAWRAVRLVGELGGTPRIDALEPPFVGRIEELRLLRELLQVTRRDQRPCLVSVIGPVGIGKTRLAWEVRKSAGGHVDETVWLTGRSPAHGDGVTFWALGEMVRQHCELVETDDEATTRTKVASAVEALPADAAERRRIESALLTLLGLGPGEARPEELSASLRAFLEHLATRGTLVLEFEDLHHADAGLLDFIDQLLEWTRASPIFVLALARPELLERRPDFGARRRAYTSIHLDPLPPDAIRELLTGLTPELPRATIDAIAARSDGVPLYAVETIRMLITDGRLVRAGTTYHAAGDLSSLTVPETLVELVAARLDDLRPADRRLALDAAVLGQTFTMAALSSVSGVPEVELADRLAALTKREILTLVADPRSVERGHYAFVQSLVREVAYNTLARADRQTLHLAAARFYEATGTDEIAGVVAAHYLAAWSSAHEGEEADVLAVQARIALTAAARRAAALGSHVQAVAFVEQALPVARDLADRADLLELAGASASSADRHRQAQALVRQAVELRRSIGEPHAIVRATALLGAVHLHEYDVDAGLSLLEAAVEEFRHLLPDPAVIELKAQLARAYYIKGMHPAAIALSDEILDVVEAAGPDRILIDTLVTKGSSLGSMGRPCEGLSLIETGRQLAEARGMSFTALRARQNSLAMRLEDDPRAVLAEADDARELARRSGDQGFTELALDVIEFAALETGDWDRGCAELEHALAGDPPTVDLADQLAMWIARRALRGEDVAEALSQLEALLPQLQDEVGRVTSATCHGVVAFAQGRFVDARAEFVRIRTASGAFAPIVRFAMLLATRLDLWMHDLEAARADLEATMRVQPVRGTAIRAEIEGLRAGIAVLEGRSDEGLTGYRSVIGNLRELGLRWPEALTSIDIVTLIDPARPEVREAADNARRILEDLRAAPLLAHLDRVVAPDADPTVSTTAQGAAGAVPSAVELVAR